VTYLLFEAPHAPLNARNDHMSGSHVCDVVERSRVIFEMFQHLTAKNQVKLLVKAMRCNIQVPKLTIRQLLLSQFEG
jgi:hypothetical protein